MYLGSPRLCLDCSAPTRTLQLHQGHSEKPTFQSSYHLVTAARTVLAREYVCQFRQCALVQRVRKWTDEWAEQKYPQMSSAEPGIQGVVLIEEEDL